MSYRQLRQGSKSPVVRPTNTDKENTEAVNIVAPKSTSKTNNTKSKNSGKDNNNPERTSGATGGNIRTNTTKNDTPNLDTTSAGPSGTIINRNRDAGRYMPSTIPGSPAPVDAPNTALTGNPTKTQNVADLTAAFGNLSLVVDRNYSEVSRARTNVISLRPGGKDKAAVTDTRTGVTLIYSNIYDFEAYARAIYRCHGNTKHVRVITDEEYGKLRRQ
ncbi:hypothetical protein HK097_009975 [Rhizophlyctis rosea]|uniref:Uncharacterized protein n=1 Tax=Rhizophlyctis rosea TaxID=64517 RepID=A0AAD5X3F8_9FUNG|nr:hypothetical protein HK097_009975 [Rhizophlyctis rosea]